MKRTTQALPKSRIILLRTAMVLALVFVFGRMFQVSVLDHTKALAAAKSQYGIKETIAAKRGKIFFRDLNGGPNYPIAMNISTYTVVADPFLIKDPTALATALAGALSLSTDEIMPKLSDQRKRFVVIKKKLDKQQSKAIEKLNLRGISLLKVPMRYYPEGTLGSQLVGFVNFDGEGQSGIERYFDEDLKGYAGSMVGEKDAKRRIIAEGKTAQPRNGTDFVLTIDHNIQYFVENKLMSAIEKFGAESGSAIVMDVKTGALLAMANEPAFDLNKYGEVPADQQYRFVNKAVTTPWEPGSIFKTFTLAAGLDMGLFEPETAIELGCSIKVNGYEIRNAENKCYKNPTMIDVLAQSVNLGTIWAADKLGNDNLAKYLVAFGFGNKTGVDIQPESNGKLSLPKQWQDVNRATISFGQGLSTTPIQTVAAYAAVANEGKLMRPYIVAKRTASDGRVIETQPHEVRQVIKPETAAKMTTLLNAVVTEGHGKRAAVPGYKVAGKTGTAQVVGENGKYEESQHIGSFAGYFPSDDPKFAMLIKLDKPTNVEFAESSAAPTFGEIAAWLLHYAKVAPSS